MLKRISLFLAAVMLLSLVPLGGASAQTPVLDPVAVRAAALAAGLGSLRDVPIPQVNNIGDFLKPGQGPKSQAVVLGKALFWDQQVGSDGMSCASCHFQAGADNRVKNQLSPGLLNTPPDNTFGNSKVAGSAGFPQFKPNYTLVGNDFEFHQLVDPLREDFNHRVIVRDTNDVVSSQGVFKATFTGVPPVTQLDDLGTPVTDAVFNVAGVNVRRVEPRNTPTVINAVFNFDNFWDGRARNQFNGINPSGTLDLSATILVNDTAGLAEKRVIIPNSSLASQAVGPPLSDLEMSYAGRKFPDVGRKLLNRRPLAFQLVHANDSVLGPFSRAGQADPKGLTFATYAEMIQQVFQDKYWNAANGITFNADGTRNISNPPGTGYTQMEANFSLFFGLAVQAYESTLISDRTRFDRFMEGDNLALTNDELAGLMIFIKTPAQANNPLFAGISQGSCISCHGGPLFSDATIPGMGFAGPIELDPATVLLNGTIQTGTELVVVDNGYYNIGVRPIAEDIGRGATAASGIPLSVSRQALQGVLGAPPLPPGTPQNVRASVDGSFKVPNLRNVELTGPYFHNGCQDTLEGLLEFYHRHTDFGEVNITELDSPLTNVRLDARLDAAGRDLDTQQLVKFLVSLTDDRVRADQAPFDHPQLLVPDGHPGDSTAIAPGQINTLGGVSWAKDNMVEIKAVGRDGRDAEGMPRLQPFLGIGAIAGTSIHLRPGWNTLSVPVKLHPSMDTWNEFALHGGLVYTAAYRWDGTSFIDVPLDYVLNPLDAIFVDMDTAATVSVVPFDGVSSPPTKNLVSGWNLLGSAFLDNQMPVRDALISAFFVPNATPTGVPLWGYTQVISPDSNAFAWAYVRDTLASPNMVLGEGYWVYMVNQGTVNGFSSTPVLR